MVEKQFYWKSTFWSKRKNEKKKEENTHKSPYNMKKNYVIIRDNRS